MNTPLRGAKGTPFEGGVRVPAFVVDLSPNQQYLGPHRPHFKKISNAAAAQDGLSDAETTVGGADEANAAEVAATSVEAAAVQDEAPAHMPPVKPVSVAYSRVFHGMMHMTDWLPTLLTLAEVPASRFPARLDGFDFTEALRSAGYEDAATFSDMCEGTILLLILLVLHSNTANTFLVISRCHQHDTQLVT